MFISSFAVTVLALVVIVRHQPWYDPQYAIPLLGMLLGNTMNGVSIAMDRFTDAAWARRGEIEARLRNHPQTHEVRLVPREETLRRFKQSEGIGEVIESLPRNPFPDAFIVLPRNETPDVLEGMRAEFVSYPGVEHVQLDSAWVKKLDALLRLIRLVVTLLAVALGMALVAVTFNTIRLQILTQGAEIEVSRLLGATDAFIRRPFYYYGALQGLSGGLVACLSVFCATWLLRKPVAELASLYGFELVLHPLSLADSTLLLGMAALLGWAGAWLSLARHLRD